MFKNLEKANDVIYYDYIIEWVDYMECYRIYHISRPNWTLAYSDDSIDLIKKEIDRQCRFINEDENNE